MAAGAGDATQMVVESDEQVVLVYLSTASGTRVLVYLSTASGTRVLEQVVLMSSVVMLRLIILLFISRSPPPLYHEDRVEPFTVHRWQRIRCASCRSHSYVDTSMPTGSHIFSLIQGH